MRRRDAERAGESDLESDLGRVMEGEVVFSSAVRAAYATDSSNYRQVPLGVVFPRTAADVAAALQVAAEHEVPVLARGAGTSLAGQACNTALVIDTSRHLTAIGAIDPDTASAVVQPGVVLDDLRRAAAPYGLTFGPDPATHAWCTLGGMIGNNSCGTHALYAGKTVDNVERLSVALYGGEQLEVGAYDDNAYVRATAAGGAYARILPGLAEIGRRVEALVAERFPRIDRRVSGYNLDQIVPGAGLHVARLLVGTESTCAVVTEARVRLVASPAQRRLVVLGYPDVFAAADAVPDLLVHDLLALEGFDAVLVERMRSRSLNVAHLGLLPPGRGWLIAELGGQSAAEADERAGEFTAGLRRGVAWRRYDQAADQARVWAIRESGLGANATSPQAGSRNFEGWEDAAVDPRRLGDYLRGVAGLWREFGYSGAWYGHFGQGCVHTRNDFQFGTAAGVARYREFVERAADLTVALGGSISGEHGDGQARGELLERMYGPEIVNAFRQVKALFDPQGRMNPGKVVDPYPLDADLRYGPAHRLSPLRPTHLSFAADHGSMQHAAERCVGVGKCRANARDTGATMCPSFRATHDELHSTRGRAKLLAEMFQGEVTPASWRNTDVRDALSLCLSCKGCAVDCPTGVDMAALKAEFLAHHYARRPRPAAMYALGLTPWINRLATIWPQAANTLLTAPGLGTTLRRSAGITTARPAPAYAARSWRRTQKTTSAPAQATVVVWPDTFTDAYSPDTGADLIAVLQAAGDRVAVPTQWACCARPLYDMGMLALARRSLRKLLGILEPAISACLPVVVPEPSCLAAFRDELPALLPDDPRAAALAALARSPAEHLVISGALDRLTPHLKPPGGPVVLHPHCHQRATSDLAAERAVLGHLADQVTVLDAGCCGLAGSFGFRAEHHELSLRIGTDQWLPAVNQALGPTGHLVTDGFSCRTQLDHLHGPPATPLPTLLRRALQQPTHPPR